MNEWLLANHFRVSHTRAVLAVVTQYTVSQKNVPPSTCYNLDLRDTITIIFGRTVTEKIRSHTMLCFSTSHMSSASALPCKIGSPEDSALVHCACNTVQQLQRSQLPFFLNNASANRQGHYSEAWVWVVSQKDWRNQAAGWIQAMHQYFIWGKCNFRLSPLYQVVQKQKLFDVA